MEILAIPGSLRRHSYNRRLLEAARGQAPQDMHINIFGELGQLPLFNEDLEAASGGDGNNAVAALRRAVDGADGVLFATPEYNQSIPGVLKNAIDWLSRTDVIAGKACAITGATTGPWGTRYAQKELRHILSSALESRVMPSPALFVPGAATLTVDQGGISDERTADALRRFLAEFAAWIAGFKLFE